MEKPSVIKWLSYLDMVGVTGSIPVAPTNLIKGLADFIGGEKMVWLAHG
jgi:hypothetical protein